MFEQHHETQPHEEVWTEATGPQAGICFVGSFEGRALVTLEVAGAPAWLAGEIAGILGLGQGVSELARKLAIDWADEASEGRHWLRVAPRRAMTAQVEGFLVKLGALLVFALAFRYLESLSSKVDWRAFVVAYAGAIALLLPISTFESVTRLQRAKTALPQRSAP